MTQQVDWLHVVLGLVAIAWTIAGPILAKRNARLAQLLGVVIQGVEQADHGPTKDAIQVASRQAGVSDHLDEVVQKQTGGAA